MSVGPTDGVVGQWWWWLVAGGQFLRVFIIAPRRNRGRKDRRNHTDRSGLRTHLDNFLLYLYLYLVSYFYLYLYLYFYLYLYLYLQKGTGVESGPTTVPYFPGMLPTLGSLVINMMAFLILAGQKYVSQIIQDISGLF